MPVAGGLPSHRPSSATLLPGTSGRWPRCERLAHQSHGARHRSSLPKFFLFHHCHPPKQWLQRSIRELPTQSIRRPTWWNHPADWKAPMGISPGEEAEPLNSSPCVQDVASDEEIPGPLPPCPPLATQTRSHRWSASHLPSSVWTFSVIGLALLETDSF